MERKQQLTQNRNNTFSSFVQNQSNKKESQWLSNMYNPFTSFSLGTNYLDNIVQPLLVDINAPCVVCNMYDYIRSLSVGVSLKYSCLTSPFRKITNSNLSTFHHVVLYQSCALGWNQKKNHGPNFSTSDCYFILAAIIFLSLIDLVGFFHEIFPPFEHSWINNSFFYHGGKTMAISTFLILQGLSSLYRRYMAIFAHPRNQCNLSTTLGCLHAGKVVMALIIILAELEQASLFVEASQLYSDLKFLFCVTNLLGLGERVPI